MVAKQREFDGGKGVADSSRSCAEVQDSVFYMEDLGELKGDKKSLPDQETSVRIIYSSLPRSSKKKLYELLNYWSNWHARNCSSGNDPAESVEDGEETYFPAIPVDVHKSSTVSFWMDSQVHKRPRTESSLDDDSAPLYDRNYPLGLTPDGGSTDENSPLVLRDTARCFNCGSYNHTLKECPKPYNNNAVSNARKEYQSKKNKGSGSRLQTRYYQNSPAGKYDGLEPGCLAAETRELLGLKDHEPPPWLIRMRQLGYPPGYLDSEEKDEPSGIMIFGDEEVNDDGSNEVKSDSKGPPKKMSVGFPGINAPIPDNANPKDWEKVQGLSGSCELSVSHIPAPPSNMHWHDLAWPRNHLNSPPLHYNYLSPPPLLTFNHPNYIQDTSREAFISPPGVPIPARSPVPPGHMTPHFSSRSPSFPGNGFIQNQNRPLPDVTHKSLWHSPA